MKRRDALRAAGVAGIASFLPFGKSKANPSAVHNAAAQEFVAGGGCVLIPAETAGPFPLDLTANSTYFRQDIRETEQGVQLNVRLKIIGLDNCLPMQNLRVNIWHCSADGLYSGYSENNNPGQAGQTYLRGYQMTDTNGEVEFITIFPGWYNGRICHIHFQVYVSSVYAAISQLTFPLTEKNAIYTANPTLYPNGTDPMTFAQDNIFSDGYNYQLATLTPNQTTGGYDTYLEVAIQGSGIATGLGSLEPETGGQFKLGQNYPNPFVDLTNIPFELKINSDVKIDLFDLQGRKVANVLDRSLGSGNHSVIVDLNALGLASTNYAYLIEVKNEKGTFGQNKLMTAKK